MIYYFSFQSSIFVTSEEGILCRHNSQNPCKFFACGNCTHLHTKPLSLDVLENFAQCQKCEGDTCEECHQKREILEKATVKGIITLRGVKYGNIKTITFIETVPKKRKSDTLAGNAKVKLA